jgi:hypothetical protein
MKTTCSLVASLLVVLIAGGCSSPSGRIERMYTGLQQDVAQHGDDLEPDPKLAKRHLERAATVREMVEKGEVTLSEDLFRAAVLLVETNAPADLELAEKLAMKAAEGGVDLARRVAAEAIDKQLVLRRLPQRYGTQYEWVRVLHAWRPYPLDPLTTDADRRVMGVPPLTEIRAGEDRLNAAVPKR